MKNYVILLILSIVLAFISYGIYAFFGFTDFSLLRKAGFFAVTLVQAFVPLFLLFFIYERSLKAENKYIQKIKDQQAAQEQATKKEG